MLQNPKTMLFLTATQMTHSPTTDVASRIVPTFLIFKCCAPMLLDLIAGTLFLGWTTLLIEVETFCVQ